MLDGTKDHEMYFEEKMFCLCSLPVIASAVKAIQEETAKAPVDVSAALTVHAYNSEPVFTCAVGTDVKTVLLPEAHKAAQQTLDRPVREWTAWEQSDGTSRRAHWSENHNKIPWGVLVIDGIGAVAVTGLGGRWDLAAAIRLAFSAHEANLDGWGAVANPAGVHDDCRNLAYAINEISRNRPH